MFDLWFWIVTNGLSSICYRQPVYRFHLKNIMTKNADFKFSSLITDYEEVWGPLNYLVAKLHQKNYDTIDTFVWKVCVSYHPLNIITLSLNSPYLSTLIPLRILVNHTAPYLWSPWIQELAINRFVLGKTIMRC